MKNLSIVLLGLVLLMGCGEVKKEEAVQEEAKVTVATAETVIKQAEMGDYAHVVYVWLKDPESETARVVFEAAMDKFANNIPYATSVHFGKPAKTSSEMIDSSYTYSFIVTFKNRADLDRYAADPVHDTFKEETGDLWGKVVIYDSVNLLD